MNWRERGLLRLFTGVNWYFCWFLVTSTSHELNPRVETWLFHEKCHVKVPSLFSTTWSPCLKLRLSHNVSYQWTKSLNLIALKKKIENIHLANIHLSVLLFTGSAHVSLTRAPSMSWSKPASVAVSASRAQLGLCLGRRNNALAKSTCGWQDFKGNLANVPSYNPKR